MKKINTQYCYLSDVDCGEFSPKSFLSKFEMKKILKYLNGQKYKDPDSDSKRLYKDLMMLFDGDKGMLVGPEQDQRSKGET